MTAFAVGTIEVLLREAALLDAGRLTGALTQVVDACTTHTASLVHLNLFHGGRRDGEEEGEEGKCPYLALSFFRDTVIRPHTSY